MPETERKDQNYPRQTCTRRKKTRRDALSHDTGTASRGQKDYPQAVQQLLRWQLYPSRPGRRSPLSPNALCFCVLPLLSECSPERSGGRRIGGGNFFIRHEETLHDMWKRILFRRQPREILRWLQSWRSAQTAGGVCKTKEGEHQKQHIKGTDLHEKILKWRNATEQRT